ncbi:MAG: eL32 family ribosomal protein [Nanoarchaeota archaeon]
MKFLRRDWTRHSKLGKKRKKKQKWRKPTGRDNKMREKRRGYPKTVSIGYKGAKKTVPRIVHNAKELEKIGRNGKIIVGKTGKRKKIEIIKKAMEMKIQIQNINARKFLKINEKASGK